MSGTFTAGSFSHWFTPRQLCEGGAPAQRGAVALVDPIADMSAFLIDTSWLAPPDMEIHQHLMQAQQQVNALVHSMHGTATLSKLQASGVDRQIKDLLAHMRQSIRDLELSSEEQDT